MRVHRTSNGGEPVLPEASTLPPRPLSHRDLPALRVRPSPGRRVRQLRTRPGHEPARLPEVQPLRDPGRVPGLGALLSPPRPARPRDRAVRRPADPLAAERGEGRRQLPLRGASPDPDHARPRLGDPDPARRVRDQAILRLVRCADRLPIGVPGVGDPGGPSRGMAPILGRPGALAPLLLHREGQHLPPRDPLAGDPDRCGGSTPPLRRRGERVAGPRREEAREIGLPGRRRHDPRPPRAVHVRPHPVLRGPARAPEPRHRVRPRGVPQALR